jgi:hypothetical protein
MYNKHWKLNDIIQYTKNIGYWMILYNVQCTINIGYWMILDIAHNSIFNWIEVDNLKIVTLYS